ncbi:MAG: competence/damage-inducible protein A [Candidatus Aminicenantes bacterium]|nr:competence/damage-inducible protein A [Candidatus Aminicenantes bacterium]
MDPVNVIILAVGSELLTPFHQDTNSLYLTRRLNDLGLDVSEKIIVGDEFENLGKAFRKAREEADLIFVTGGLGPTDDDRTREAVSSVLKRPLEFREDILRTIEERFLRRGKTMPAANRKQAEVIRGAEVLPNSAGTAPGLWIEDEAKIIVLLPGPPPELQSIFETQVRTRLAGRERAFLVRRVLKTSGLTESEVESLIEGLYPRDPARRLTILASPGQIELHVSAFSGVSAAEAERQADALTSELGRRLGPAVFSADGSDLETVVGRLLSARKETVAVAESCTGGLVCRRLTRIPGSSTYFREGFVTYANQAKIDRLGVPARTIESFGAVSPETAAAMAEGVRHVAGADYGLAVTGIAGPSGGTAEKPVGLVFCAVADAEATRLEHSLFLGDRTRVQDQSSQKVLDMLRRFLEEKSSR